MKIITYTDASSRVVEVFPCSGARLCSGFVKDGETVECDPPVMFDRIQDALGQGVTFTVVYAEDEDTFVARIRDKDVPASAGNVQIVDFETLPGQQFRNAWKFADGAVVVDMTAARSIHRDHLRVLRAPKLAALDVAYMRAMERGDTQGTAAVAAQKQTLRDVTKAAEIDAATTPDQLAAAVPAILSS